MPQFNASPDEPLLRQAHESLAATEVPPGPSAELIQRVSNRMEEECSPSAYPDRSRWTKRRASYAMAAVLLVVAVGLAIFSPRLGNRVLADMVNELEALKSVKATLTKSIDGVEVESTTVIFKGKSLRRMEFSSGDVDVLNMNRGEHTRLMAAEKRVVVEPAYMDGEDPISRLKKLASQPMGRIPARTIDGVESALGFSRQEAGRTQTIWVDPKTRLPIRGEATFEKNADGKTVTTTLGEIEYNIDIEDSFFEIRLPETYKLVDRRPAKVEGSVDLDSIELVLTPNKGLGPITFGMSREDVIKLLGSPDSSEVDKSAGIEQFERLLKDPNLADSHESIRKSIEHLKTTERYRVGFECLRYSSKGFELVLLPSEGVLHIACNSQSSSFRHFEGRTQEGLRMLDSRERIERLYGKPEEVQGDEEGFSELKYSKLGLRMGLQNNKLASLRASRTDD